MRVTGKACRSSELEGRLLPHADYKYNIYNMKMTTYKSKKCLHDGDGDDNDMITLVVVMQEKIKCDDDDREVPL